MIAIYLIIQNACSTLVAGYLRTNDLLKDISGLNVNTELFLDNQKAIPAADGRFEFSVPPGSYALTVVSAQFIYGDVRIEVMDENYTAYVLQPGTYWDVKGTQINTPVELKPIAVIEYFQKPEQFNFLSLLMNPMIFMSALTIGILFVMPKLQAQLDEAQKEIAGSAAAPKAEEVLMLPQIPDMSATLADWFVPSDSEASKKSNK